MTPATVVIVGGGFAGTLQAINLLRHDGPRAILIERRARAGEGLAYGEAAPGHVLNVRATGMSALPDEPDHFVNWLRARGEPDPARTFVPRLTYGAYMRDLLDAAIARQPGRLTIVSGDAVDVRLDKGIHVHLADGRVIDGDSAILAIGNLPPHHPRGLDSSWPGDLYAADPWSGALGKDLTDDDTVLIIGTGLTMVDIVLKLADGGFGGRILALSRRGLIPHRHADQPSFDPIADRPPARASALIRSVRRRADTVGWRNAVDELRRFTTPLWRGADAETRARFLRHLRPWWDIHRHRIAPRVAERLAHLMAEGRLTAIAAKTIAFAPDDHGRGLRATFRRRGETDPETITVRRVINCTGPQGDLLSSREPLLRRLVDRGLIRPDALHIGIDVDSQARVIARDGHVDDRLYAIGPMTRGAFWEIVAVPDIRTQVWSLGRRLSHAHWVGGEGL